MKLFKASVILQIIYCISCVIAIAFLLLFRAFYDTEVGDFCYNIGTIFTIITLFTPLGLIGTILNWIAFFTSEMKNSKKALVWLILSPILIAMSWIISCTLLVELTGGV